MFVKFLMKTAQIFDINQTMNKSINESIHQSINQSIHQSTHQSNNPSKNQASQACFMTLSCYCCSATPLSRTLHPSATRECATKRSACDNDHARVTYGIFELALLRVHAPAAAAFLKEVATSCPFFLTRKSLNIRGWNLEGSKRFLICSGKPHARIFWTGVAKTTSLSVFFLLGLVTQHRLRSFKTPAALQATS